jgi:hypothetical protein
MVCTEHTVTGILGFLQKGPRSDHPLEKNTKRYFIYSQDSAYVVQSTEYGVRSRKYEIPKPCMPRKIRGPVPCFLSNIITYSKLVLISTESTESTDYVKQRSRPRPTLNQAFNKPLFFGNSNLGKGASPPTLAMNFPFHFQKPTHSTIGAQPIPASFVLPDVPCRGL